MLCTQVMASRLVPQRRPSLEVEGGAMADAYALVERRRRPLGGASPLAVYAVVALVAIGVLLAG